MKYVCMKNGTYQVLDIVRHRELYYEKLEANIISINLCQKTLYEIEKLDIVYSCYEQYAYKLMTTNGTYYIDEYTFNKCFKLPTITHYETKYFSDVGEMNNFLKTIPCDRFKDIKIQNKDYLVIYRVDGEV